MVGGGDPERGGDDGGAMGGGWGSERRLVRRAAGVDKLDGEEDEEGEVEADPVGERRGGHVTMLSRVRLVIRPMTVSQ